MVAFWLEVMEKPPYVLLSCGGKRGREPSECCFCEISSYFKFCTNVCVFCGPLRMGAVLIEVRGARCPQAVVSFLMWVMGVEPETSGRAVDTLNHC